MTITLYELAGADKAVRFSPHCWKARFALAHKGLAFETKPVRFTDKEAIAFSGQTLTPILAHDDVVVTDSFAIADYLDKTFADAPLFPDVGARTLARFANGWADALGMHALFPAVITSLFAAIDERDRAYFRETRESRFGKTLEQVAEGSDAATAAFAKALAPLRRALDGRAFLGGDAPIYADYCALGPFIWARCAGAPARLADDDPIAVWRDRLLDAFDGMARNAPCAAAA